MADLVPVEIPNRALFKASEVCELLKLQPYVLKTWEAEFPELGVVKSSGAARVYRRDDVEQVLRIKNLLLVEGLTLAGARRRIEEQAPVTGAGIEPVDEFLGQQARARLAEIKSGLRSLLELLSGQTGGGEFRLAAPVQATAAAGERVVGEPSERTPAVKARSKPSASPKGKRSA